MKFPYLSEIDNQRIEWSIAVGIILSVILGFGAYTQVLFVNGVLGEADCIYESLTPSGFRLQQSFSEWFVGFYNIVYLPFSIITCYIAFKQRNARSVFIWVFIGACITLAVVDTCYALFMPELNVSLFESYLSNLLGSPIIAFCVCLILLYQKDSRNNLTLKTKQENYLFLLLCVQLFFLGYLLSYKIYFG